MSQRGDRNDIEDRVSDLETTLAELRRELREPRREQSGRSRPPRGPFGLPRPPRPEQILRFTEQYALPTAIAMLEAQMRALEGLRAVLRAMDRGRTVGESANRTRERAETLGRETLSALDRTLDDLGTAIESGGLPDSPVARDLLSDAQRLTDEIESELREARDTDGYGRDAEAVEEEIQILRDEFDDEDDSTSDMDEPPP